MKLLNILISLAIAYPTSAQVGINTKNPQGILHIDAKDNTSGNTNSDDDIIVTQDGNLGIGTLNPTTKLHIVSSSIGKGFALQDGSQGSNYILVSDNNGNAYWTESEVSQFTIIPSATSPTTTFAGNTYKYDPGFRLTFPRYGTYSVSIITRLILNRSANETPIIRVQLVSATTVNDYLGSAQILATPISSTTYHQAYINQNIEVTAAIGLIARLEYSVSGQFIATTGTLTTIWNGTYIRVK